MLLVQKAVRRSPPRSQGDNNERSRTTGVLFLDDFTEFRRDESGTAGGAGRSAEGKGRGRRAPTPALTRFSPGSQRPQR
jgi:hypothetical protein